MRLAVQTPVQHTTFDRLRAQWQAADRAGYVAAYTFDHFVPLAPGARPNNIGEVPSGTQLEGWMTLAALAVHTERLQVGTLATGVTHRPPAVLAKMATTLDHLTGGRAILGVGAGWHETEHRMLGLPFPPVGERMALLERTIETFRAMCAPDSPYAPKPVRPGGIPVLIGGSGDRLRGIVARCADVYNGFWAPDQWPEVNRDLDRRLLAAGRRPEDLERTVFVHAELSGDPARQQALVAEIMRTRGGTEAEARAKSLVGTPAEMIAVLQSYAAAGVGTAVLTLAPDTTPDDIARLPDDLAEVLTP